MRRSRGGESSFWAGLLALLVVGVLLGVRAVSGMSIIDEASGTSSIAPDSEAASQRALLADLDAKAVRLMDSASVARDPFKDARRKEAARAAVVSAATSESAAVEPDPDLPPTLRAVVYDPSKPIVQLSTCKLLSGWLREGELFEGWKIDKIESKSVTVTRGAETIVLKLM